MQWMVVNAETPNWLKGSEVSVECPATKQTSATLPARLRTTAEEEAERL